MASTTATAPSPIPVGALVNVRSRTDPGINKPGGVGVVRAVRAVEGGGFEFDVAYVLGGSERSVAQEFVQPHQFEGGRHRTSATDHVRPAVNVKPPPPPQAAPKPPKENTPPPAQSQPFTTPAPPSSSTATTTDDLTAFTRAVRSVFTSRGDDSLSTEDFFAALARAGFADRKQAQDFLAVLDARSQVMLTPERVYLV